MMFSTKAEYGVRVMVASRARRRRQCRRRADPAGLDRRRRGPAARLPRAPRAAPAQGGARGVAPGRARRLLAGAPAGGHHDGRGGGGARGRDRPDRVHHRRRRRRARLRPRGRGALPDQAALDPGPGVDRAHAERDDAGRPGPPARGSRRRSSPHDAGDPEPARPHRGPGDPPRREPDREARARPTR